MARVVSIRGDGRDGSSIKDDEWRITHSSGSVPVHWAAGKPQAAFDLRVISIQIHSGQAWADRVLYWSEAFVPKKMA